MNRRLRTDLPTHHKKLLPKLTDLKATRKALEQRKLEQNDIMTAQQKNYHLYTRMIECQKWGPAVVIDLDETPRPYHVRTQDGSTFRRNRRHVLQVPKSEDNEQTATAETTMTNVERSLTKVSIK